jgi:bifunctional UDP-N-acetylglucosamine pyrophosphorylase/glucosamine-1-phosphate N-acetyltransferase
VFIGSDAVLVAPLTIADGAFVAAGSVITNDVEPDAMAFGRARQADKPGAAAAFRAAHAKGKN